MNFMNVYFLKLGSYVKTDNRLYVMHKLQNLNPNFSLCCKVNKDQEVEEKDWIESHKKQIEEPLKKVAQIV